MARARRRDVPNPPARRSRARRPAGGTGWTGETGETLETLETLGTRSARGVRHAAMKARRSATSALCVGRRGRRGRRGESDPRRPGGRTSGARPGGGIGFDRRRRIAQCDSSTGTVIDSSIVRVTPPSTRSRARVWP
nr:hypothetical protein DO63_5755 [Burkholderia pseudomallei]